jgi:hypothetical protein
MRIPRVTGRHVTHRDLLALVRVTERLQAWLVALPSPALLFLPLFGFCFEFSQGRNGQGCQQAYLGQEPPPVDSPPQASYLIVEPVTVHCEPS